MIKSIPPALLPALKSPASHWNLVSNNNSHREKQISQVAETQGYTTKKKG